MHEEKLIIISDNCFIKKAIEDLFLFTYPRKKNKAPLMIVFIESDINTPDVLDFISSNELISSLVFATNKNMKFISAIKRQKNMTIREIGLPLMCIIKDIVSFIEANSESEEENVIFAKKNILTKNEKNVFFLYIQGVQVISMAKRLNRNKKTIYSHINNATRKLGLSNTSELILKANALLKINQSGTL